MRSCGCSDVICFFCHEKAHVPHRNWGEYNASLKQWVSLTVWVSSEAVENWTADKLTGEPGASPTYTDLAIETKATIQIIYGLPGRQTQGFLQSVFEFRTWRKLHFRTDEATPEIVIVV